jgi:DNA-binding transcriptional LysR family regulator
LLDHTVDIGIIRRSAVVESLKFYALGDFGYSLFVPKSWGKGKVKLDELPLAMTLTGELQSYLASLGKMEPALRVLYRCTSFTQAAQLVRCGTAGAVLPDLARQSLADVARPVEVPWLIDLRRDLVVAWHGRVAEVRPPVTKLKDALCDLLEKRLKARVNSANISI